MRGRRLRSGFSFGWGFGCMDWGFFDFVGGCGVFGRDCLRGYIIV